MSCHFPTSKNGFPFRSESPFGPDFPFGSESPFGPDFPFGSESPFGPDFPFGSESSSKSEFPSDDSNNVFLNDVEVTKEINSAGSITALNTKLRNINVGKDVTLTSTICNGEVRANGNITTKDSFVEKIHVDGKATLTSTICNGEVNADSLTADNCDLLGWIKTAGSATLNTCPQVLAVSGGNVNLQQVEVHGDVSAVDATIENSTIGGTLTCVSNHLIIKKSAINTINLHCLQGKAVQSERTSGNKGIFLERSMSTRGRGFSIPINDDGATSSNVLMNDDGIIVSGDLNKIFIGKVPLSQFQPTETHQTLELHDSIVKNVIFEGGNGEVILSGASKINNITGGKIRT